MYRRLSVIILLLIFLLTNITSQITTTYKTDKPKSGEGVNMFLKRHNLNIRKYKSHFLKINAKNIGKNNSLKLGVEYKIPNTVDVIDNYLYGEKNRKFKIIDNALGNASFYLIAGHGGPDPGAMGTYKEHTLCEDEYAYDIILRLSKKLEEHGANVELIIKDKNDGIRDECFLKMDKDELCDNKELPLDQLSRLKQRTKYVNKLYRKDKAKYKRCIVIHIDSRNKGKAIDVFFYHAPKSKKGKSTAKEIVKVFDKKYSKFQPSRGYSGIVKSRGLYMLRKTLPVSVFIELGNIRNYRDQQRFILENNRQAIANWIYEGLLNDYKKN